MRGRSLLPVAGIFVILAIAGAGAEGEQSSGKPDAPTVYRASGSDLYRTYCAVCHGRSAKGDGPLAESMKRRPPDLTLFASRNGGTYPAELVRKIIDGRQPLPGHGGPDMPAWGDAFKESRGGLSEEEVAARIDALVRHLESVQMRNAQHGGGEAQQSTR